MKKIVDPFIDFLPTIDLHGMDRVLTKIKVEEFINDNVKLRNKKVVIIHGIGQGIVKDEVFKTLKINKNVESFKLNGMNIGCTIVNLKWED
ncbi:MAG: Smr/MutS family protein [Bacilli bacterium]|nr:Smr/MutS family protein [Bacilli bacterium]